MAELEVLRPSVIEDIEQWMQNLNRSDTPCFLCKHKSGGEQLFELSCEGFPGTLIPPFIFNGTKNHAEIFKGNATRTNVFTNKYAKQNSDNVFEFDNSFRIINELLEHSYTVWINEANPESAENLRKDIKKAIKRVRPTKEVV